MATQLLTNNQTTQITNQDNVNSTESNVIQTGKYKVYSSNKGSLQKLTSYDQIKFRHHGGGSYQTTKIDGQSYTTRSDGGKLRVVQDMVLEQGGKYNVDVPSGVSGYAVVKRDIKPNGKGYGNYVEIQDAPGGKGKVIARYAHLASTKVKDGDKIKRGTILGVQGDSGAPGSTHLHVEMEQKEYAKYIEDLQSGKFSNKQTSAQKTSSDSISKTNDITAYKDGIDSHNYTEESTESKSTSTQETSSDNTIEAISSQAIGNSTESESTSTQETSSDNTIEATSSQEIGNSTESESTSAQEANSDETIEEISSQSIGNSTESESTSTQEIGNDSTSKTTSTVSNDSDKTLNNETTTNLPKIYEGNNIQENNNTNVSKVVELLRQNRDEVKQQYGLDVTTHEGLGKAVMQYWKENKLDPKSLKDQLPQVSNAEFETVSKQVNTIINNVSATKDKQFVS
jgi:Peptidase family M23